MYSASSLFLRFISVAVLLYNFFLSSTNFKTSIMYFFFVFLIWQHKTFAGLRLERITMNIIILTLATYTSIVNPCILGPPGDRLAWKQPRLKRVNKVVIEDYELNSCKHVMNQVVLIPWKCASWRQHMMSYFEIVCVCRNLSVNHQR